MISGIGATLGGGLGGTAGALASGGTMAMPSAQTGAALGAATTYTAVRATRAIGRTAAHAMSSGSSGGGRGDDAQPERRQQTSVVKNDGGTSGNSRNRENMPSATVEISIKQAELRKFGARRKIEQAKSDSKIGQNKLTTPDRNPNITRGFREIGRRQLRNQGSDPNILRKVDADHTHELQLGGADRRTNLQFIDRGFNRAIGKRINNATKEFPEGTKIDVKFKVKETGEEL